MALALASTSFVRCRQQQHHPAAVLLFTGTGTSRGDVTAVETILKANHLEYAAVDSTELNDMSESQMQAFHLLIIPGGNFINIGRGLTSRTAANIRGSVRGGLNYLGICAGAFFAGNSPFNGLNLTSGVTFQFYAAERRGVRKAPVAVTTADGETLEQYWEDGPELSGWGTVIGKYPDGTPAIVEGKFGSGFVILSGVHPEAPERWRVGMTFRTPVAEDNEYAGRVVTSALKGKLLPHY